MISGGVKMELKINIYYNSIDTKKTKILLNEVSLIPEKSEYIFQNQKIHQWLLEFYDNKDFFSYLYSFLVKNDYSEPHNVIVNFYGFESDYVFILKAIDFTKEKELFKSITSKLFKVKDKDLSFIFDKTKIIFNKINNGPISDLIPREINSRFNQILSNDFNISIIGTMSSGKSTFLNAIFGKNLLPSGMRRETAFLMKVKDNDNLNEFKLKTFDKDNNLINQQEATLDAIRKINNARRENQSKHICSIEIEGRIKSIDSDVINAVFIDTPGGNAANIDLSEEFLDEQIMDDVIYDEYNGIIMYVLNSDNALTHDSDKIIKKIANVLEQKSEGSMSLDRVFFVINKADAYSNSEGNRPENTLHEVTKILENYGIKKPNIFFVSSIAALLSRKNDAELNEDELDEKDRLFKRFSRHDIYKFWNYSTISKSEKKYFDKEYQNALDSKNINQLLELCSGIRLIENSINNYINFYAIPMKIEKMHNSFMSYINELNILEKYKKNLYNSKEKMDKSILDKENTEKEIEIKKKLEDFKKKINELSFDDSLFNELLLESEKELNDINKYLHAYDIVDQNTLIEIKKNVVNRLSDLEKKQNEIISKSNSKNIQNSNKLVKQYQIFVNSLQNGEMFKIDSISFNNFSNISAFDLETFKKSMNTFTSIETKVSKEMRIPEFSWRGFFDFILIIFGNDERTVFKREESTNIKSFAENFEKNELKKRINEIEKHLNALKNSTIKTLDNLKRTVNQRLKEIEVEIVNTKSKFENIKKDIEKNKTYHQSEQIKLNFTQQIIDEMNELVRFEYE
jgi:hypothetical protein